MNHLASLIVLAYQEAANQAPAGAEQPAPGPGGIFSSPLVPMVLTVVVIMFLMKPFGQREDKKQKQLLDSLKKNDRVLLYSGVYARIVNVKSDVDEVVVKVDEDRDVKLTVTKSAIMRKLEKSDKEEEPKEKAST